MTSLCSVPRCKSTELQQIRLFKSPENLDQKKYWLNFLIDCGVKVGLQALKKDFFICSCHFISSNFQLDDRNQLKLKPCALPTKKNQHEERKIGKCGCCLKEGYHEVATPDLVEFFFKFTDDNLRSDRICAHCIRSLSEIKKFRETVKENFKIQSAQESNLPPGIEVIEIDGANYGDWEDYHHETECDKYRDLDEEIAEKNEPMETNEDPQFECLELTKDDDAENNNNNQADTANPNDVLKEISSENNEENINTMTSIQSEETFSSTANNKAMVRFKCPHCNFSHSTERIAILHERTCPCK
jgi:hypothetical protein